MRRAERRDEHDAVLALLHEAGDAGVTTADVAVHLGVPHEHADRLLTEVAARDGAALRMPTASDDDFVFRYQNTAGLAPPLAARETLAAMRTREEPPRRYQRRRELAWALGALLLVTAAVALLLVTVRSGRARPTTDAAGAAATDPLFGATEASTRPAPSSLEQAAAVRLAALRRTEAERELGRLRDTATALETAARECRAAVERPCYHEGRLLSAGQLAEELAWVHARSADLTKEMGP